MPPSLQLTLNVPISLPPGVDIEQLPPAIQQLLQQAQQALAQISEQAVQQALRQQAQLVGFQVRRVGARWRHKA
jgi:hypothetical protein